MSSYEFIIFFNYLVGSSGSLGRPSAFAGSWCQSLLQPVKVAVLQEDDAGISNTDRAETSFGAAESVDQKLADALQDPPIRVRMGIRDQQKLLHQRPRF